MRQPIIVRDVDQSSQEWADMRTGIPTASEFGSIVTAAQCKRSSGANGYRAELVAECYGECRDISSIDMENGAAAEQFARAGYEFLRGVEIEEVGFVYGDDSKTYGCSPDGLSVCGAGGVELKCPKLKTVIKYSQLSGIPSAYLPQVYGCLWVTGREWWDFYCHSVHDAIPAVWHRVTREDKHYRKWAGVFEEALPEFLSALDDLRARCGLARFGEGPVVPESKVW